MEEGELQKRIFYLQGIMLGCPPVETYMMERSLVGLGMEPNSVGNGTLNFVLTMGKMRKLKGQLTSE